MRLYRKLFILPSALLLAVNLSMAEPEDIHGPDIINRVDRVLRVSPSTARTWHAGVASLDTWPARLERALLETLGPPELREAEAGLHALEILLDEASTSTPVTDEARETLAVLVELIDRQVALAREHDRATRALEAEREAHRQTTDKLNSLRQIDHQLDERENDGGR